MTPKDKARELVDTFYSATGNWQSAKQSAKQRALKCVDEIMEETKIENYDLTVVYSDYWQQVKQEIEKL